MAKKSVLTLDAKAAGLSAGLIWGVGLMLLTFISINNGYAANFLAAITEIYPGYEVTQQGSIIGFIWGFIDAGIGFWLFATLYNVFAKRGK